MSTPEQKQVVNIRDKVIQIIHDHIVDNTELDKKDVAPAMYDTVVSVLSPFMAQTKLQARILNECRTLEMSLKNSKIDVELFDVVLMAKPKTARAETAAKDNFTKSEETEVVNATTGEDKTGVGD